jgi:hypothetical protein
LKENESFTKIKNMQQLHRYVFFFFKNLFSYYFIKLYFPN